MGKFVDAVRGNVVLGPLRRGFDSAQWDVAFESLCTDEIDRSLHAIGLLVFDKANAVRSQSKLIFSSTLRATTKLRALVAVANRDLRVLAQKTQEAMAAIRSRNEMVMIPDLLSVKVALPVGVEFSPDHVVQSMVDGIQIPIRVILGANPSLLGNAEYSDIDWPSVVTEFNLGNSYKQLEGLWDDCLWNGYTTESKDGIRIFSPSDPFWAEALCTSQLRYDNLGMQFFTIAHSIYKNLGIDRWRQLNPQRDILGITRTGRKQHVRISSASEQSDKNIGYLVARDYATEPYYEGILKDRRDMLGGATIDDLLAAWSVVSRIASTQRSQLDSSGVETDGHQKSMLPQHVPVLKRETICRALADASGVNGRQAKAIVEFLTFRGSGDQELWAQPLVPVGDDTLAPVFAAVEYPNLRRLVDVWIKQLGIDMSLRGPAFEQFVRSELHEYIKASAILRDSRVLQRGLTFKSKDFRDEQIDVVVVLEDLVIIGEAKCALRPTDAKQYAMHRKTVRDAASQVQRKADTIAENREQFRLQLGNQGVVVSENFRVLPIVILNSAIHAGIEVDGVCIADMHILKIFFDGELVDIAMQDRHGEMKHLKKRVFYVDSKGASEVAEQYFRSPPQMEALKLGLRRSMIPILPLNEGDWVGAQNVFECMPDYATVLDS